MVKQLLNLWTKKEGEKEQARKKKEQSWGGGG